MCGRLDVSGHIAVPGTTMQFSAGKGKRIGIWGISGHNGIIHNARRESLEGYWRPIKDNRGILPVNAFIEPEGPVFGLKDNPVIGLAVIHDENNRFVVVTENSTGVVKDVHPRMPIIITNNEEWLVNGIIRDPDADKIIMMGRIQPVSY